MVPKSTQSQKFDVIIVGGGPAGLFAAYHLCEHSNCRILLIEKGKGPLKRCCPMNSTHQCVQCRPCNILSGIGGAGLFSDGKLNFIHKLGKTDLTQFLPESEARALIDETEKIFNLSAWTARCIRLLWEPPCKSARRPRCMGSTC